MEEMCCSTVGGRPFSWWWKEIVFILNNLRGHITLLQPLQPFRCLHRARTYFTAQLPEEILLTFGIALIFLQFSMFSFLSRPLAKCPRSQARRWYPNVADTPRSILVSHTLVARWHNWLTNSSAALSFSSEAPVIQVAILVFHFSYAFDCRLFVSNTEKEGEFLRNFCQLSFPW